MRPAMRDAEIALLASVMRCSSRYVEFGAGGSTVLASRLVADSVISIDSSREWLHKVEVACSGGDGIMPTRLHADIGPIRALGYPDGNGHRHLWANYHTTIWDKCPLAAADALLVDGRFRVACFVQAVLRCHDRALLLMHDFACRPAYHVVRLFAREVARADDLSLFQKLPDLDTDAAESCLRLHAFDPR